MQYIHKILAKSFMGLKTKSRNLPFNEVWFFFFGQAIELLD